MCGERVNVWAKYSPHSFHPHFPQPLQEKISPPEPSCFFSRENEPRSTGRRLYGLIWSTGRKKCGHVALGIPRRHSLGSFQGTGLGKVSP
jgi:hypothetical protein